MTAPLPSALAPLAIPLSWIYGAVVARRNRRLDSGRGVTRVARPVISIGNLTAGGTGKTPMVRWAATVLRAEGHQPVIAQRGYGARGGRESDEALEYRLALPEVSVLSNPDRAVALAQFLPRHPEVDCVLLDDGFQHRRLARDLDIVLVDATCPFRSARLLPAGYLREPRSALRRADAVVVTRAERVDADLAEAVERHHGRAPVAWCRHAWPALVVHEGGSTRREPVAWLSRQRVATMFGVGNPEAVRDQVRRAGAEIAHDTAIADHADLDDRGLAELRDACAGTSALFVTAKDWVKLEPRVHSWPVPIVVPELVLAFLDGEAPLRACLVATVTQ